jgi:integrase
MREVTIDGACPQLFNDFIAYKRGLGYGYPTQTIDLIRQLSRFLDEHPAESIITEEIAVLFCMRRDGEAASTRNKRTSMIRQFALYLNRLGINCYVPPKGNSKATTDFVPYIFSAAEIYSMIAVAEGWVYRCKPATLAADRVYPMLIKVLWCSGLRISEALSLTLGDVDRDGGILTVRKAKYNQIRLIPVSDSLAQDIDTYWAAMNFDFKQPSDYFFPNHKGQRYVREASAHHIKRIMLKAGITRDGKMPPRVHDIRHSYAVAALKKMEDEGTDIYCSLPLLSTFMGHSDIKSTEYYLRLTHHQFPELLASMTNAYRDVFPEVDDE